MVVIGDLGMVIITKFANLFYQPYLKGVIMRFGSGQNSISVDVNKSNIRSITANSIEINAVINVKQNTNFADEIGNVVVFTTNQESTAVIKAPLADGNALAAAYMGSNNPTKTILLFDVSYAENRISASSSQVL